MDRAHVAPAVNRRILATGLYPSLVLCFLLLYPLGNLVFQGLFQGSSTLWSDSQTWNVIRFTYVQAFFSTCISSVIGTWGALLYSDQRFIWRSALWRGSLVCFSLPPILVATACLAYWRGLNLDFYGWTGIVLAHAFFNFPLFVKNVGLSLIEMDRSQELSALSLGASRWRCFIEITWRKIFPSFAGAFILCFLYCATSFLIPLLVGGGPRFTTLEVMIYQSVKIELDLPTATRLALIQIGVSGALYLLFLRVSMRAVSTGRTLSAPALYRVPRRPYLFVLAFVAMGPLTTMVWHGLKGFGHVVWSEVFRATLDSLCLAAISSALGVSLALALAHAARHANGRGPKLFFHLMASAPLSVSSIIVSFGLLLSYPSVVTELRGSFLAVAFVQAIGMLPATFRFVSDGLERIPESWHHVAQSLGAGPWRRFVRLEIPELRGSLAGAFLMGVAYSFGEVGAVLMFAAEGFSTLPLHIYRLLGQYRFESAEATGVVLLGLMLLVHAMMGKIET